MTSLLDDASTHHIWATERSIDACATLTREQPAPIDEESNVTLADLRAAIVANGAVWRDILASDPDPEADLIERGDEWAFHQPAGRRLAQAIHHGTDHRCQVCTALTSHGIATGHTRAIEG